MPIIFQMMTVTQGNSSVDPGTTLSQPVQQSSPTPSSTAATTTTTTGISLATNVTSEQQLVTSSASIPVSSAAPTSVRNALCGTNATSFHECLVGSFFVTHCSVREEHSFISTRLELHTSNDDCKG